MKKPQNYSSLALQKQILADAKSLGIAQGWAETIATKTTQHVDAWIKDRGTVTESDITRIAHQKLKQYSPDLAYIYKNRGKIL